MHSLSKAIADVREPAARVSRVDVIVPCYRYGHYLRECVQSVLDQQGVEVRVLILDDASPDNTPEIGADLAREDRRVTFSRHETNKGHIATFNEGIEWASSDYVLLLSADDYLMPGACERAVALLDANPDVGFVFGNAIELQEDGSNTEIGIEHRAMGSGAKVLTGAQFIELNWPNNVVPTPTAIIRTALQKRVGGYRPQLTHAGDMEMWLRLAAHGSVGVIDAPQGVYRRHASNMSYAYFRRSKLPDLEQRRLAADCFFETCGHLLSNAEDTRRRMMRDLSFNAVGYASSAFNEGDMDLSDQFAKLAVDLSPGVTKTLPWIKFASKRRIGLKGWLALQPAAQKILSLATGRKR